MEINRYGAKNYSYIKAKVIFRAIAGDSEANCIIIARYFPYIKTCIANKARNMGLKVDWLPMDELISEVVVGVLEDIRKFKAFNN